MMKHLIGPKIVDGLLEKTFEINGEKRSYTEDEVAFIKDETDRLFAEFTKGKNPTKKGNHRYFLTAGDPGSGKSTLIERLIESDPVLANAVYLDPDETIMRNMPIYQQDIDKMGVEDAYTKWRWASQYIWHSLRNRASEEGYDIINGTTATSDLVELEYQNVIGAGYKPITIAVCASEQVRRESIEKRYKETGERYVPEKDIRDKGSAFFQKIPLYLEYSNAVRFYFRSSLNQGAQLAVSVVGAQMTANRAIARDFYKELQANGVNVSVLFDMSSPRAHNRLKQ